MSHAVKFEQYELIQISETSWRIETDIVRAFLFIGTERALLVDTTNYPYRLDAAVRSLTDKPVMLVNTHADEDHISANHCFREAWMHPAEYAYYAQKRKEGYAEPKPLQDGEIIELGGQRFEVILIPGHTPGSIALLDRENGILVSGDSISDRPVFIFGEMRNLDALKVSLARLQARQEEFRWVYPSHGTFPLEKEQIARELSCAEKLQRGEIVPQEPPFPMPAKMFCADGAGFYCSMS